MELVHADSIYRLSPGERPNYNSANPILKLLTLVQEIDLAAEREVYLGDSLQHLVPFRSLELYGPSPPHDGVLDPTQQDNKTDFQKQNVRSFLTADARLSRGLVVVGGRTFPVLRVSYRGGPDSVLSRAAGDKLGPSISMWIKVAGVETRSLIVVPYNPRTDCYDVELWGFTGGDLRAELDVKGRDAFDRGIIVVAPDLVHGDPQIFARDNVTDRYLAELDPTHTMHPILPLHVETAWTDASRSAWDSQGGANHQFEFNMIVRGWENFLSAGVSPNPHGGVGFLEYRNLLSNYGRYAGSKELARTLEPWNFNAYGAKNGGTESFMAVDYMDLHVLHGSCGIGLHRHRDNQEVFFMTQGRALMVVGDWCKFPNRERCFEVRTLRAGHLAMLKGGNLHGLVNTTDEDISLFMFGGYD